jgi:hypothetical protein
MDEIDQRYAHTAEKVKDDHDSESAYGTDFDSDEEALLNELLANVSTTSPPHQPNTTTQTVAGGEEQVQTEQSVTATLRLTDIEDYESPREVRLPKQPKVVGKGAFVFSPAWNRRRIQSGYQSSGGPAVG